MTQDSLNFSWFVVCQKNRMTDVDHCDNILKDINCWLKEHVSLMTLSSKQQMGYWVGTGTLIIAHPFISPQALYRSHKENPCTAHGLFSVEKFPNIC